MKDLQGPTEPELAEMTETELDAYAKTFTGAPEPFQMRPDPGNRSCSISVRFSAEELDELRQRAESAGLKVTAYIRSAALASGDVERLRQVRQRLARLSTELERLVG